MASSVITNLVTGATGDGDSAVAKIDIRGLHGKQVPAQIAISGTATVAIMGRLHSGHAWKSLGSTSSSDVVMVTPYPEMISRISGSSGATVSADIMAPTHKVVP